jgi:ABC-type multidrug transport system fused ATPase/permease subunit
VLLLYGGYLVVHGRIPLGAGMFVMANLLHEFANQIGNITNIANTIQGSLIAAQRVFEVLDSPVQIASPPGAVRLPRAKGRVTFDHVDFSYQPGQVVLRDVTLDVQAGECVAIAGETAAGKSTLLSLIARFYEVDRGAVLLDGIDVRKLDLDDLRRNIGIVFQESFLFSNTAGANIAFGHPDATQEQIERAAKIAAAHEFISRLPDGYETLIGEHGSNLSGGQRQRLAIARALLLDPPILILDDALAAVDAETEHEIQLAIDNATQGRTTFLVSNRISALRRADRIIVLQQGRVAQVGTHDELVVQPGYYRRLMELQFGDLAETT